MKEESINLNSEKIKNIPLSNIREKVLLTLRKQKINKSHLTNRLKLIMDNEQSKNYSININALNISSNNLVNQFNNTNDQIQKLNLLLMMLISSDQEILKFSLYHIRNFTFTQDEKTAKEINMINIINKKVIDFLYNLICIPNQDKQIIYTILEIFIYLTYNLNDYIEILLEKSEIIFKFAKETNDISLKKKYLWCILHLLSGTEEQIQKLLNKCSNLSDFIVNELENSINDIKKNIDILPIYICLFGCLFFSSIETDKLFENESKIFKLIQFIIKCTNITYNIYLFKESINTFKLILENYVNNPKFSENHEYNKKFKSVLKKSDISKFLSHYLYNLIDEQKKSYDNIDFIIIEDIFSILVNISVLSDFECEKMITCNILEYINFIFNLFHQNPKIIKKGKIFSLILTLLYNFTSCDDLDIIDSMTRKVYIVRSLMDLYKLPESQKYKCNILEILEKVLEYPNTKVKTELTVDHIEDFYSYCLDEKEIKNSEEIIQYVLKGIKILLEYGNLFGKYNAMKIQFERKEVRTKLEKISLDCKSKNNSMFAAKILNEFFKEN